MTYKIPFSSIIQKHVLEEIPSRWLDCPRKSTIIDGKFIAFKTPLDDQYKTSIPIDKRWTCGMLIKYTKDDQKKLGLVIDLTNTERYYSSDAEFIKKDIRYKKIRCQGHNETPTEEQINQFIRICDDFLTTNPNDIIGVHCTHGFNRTGFLICAYLCRQVNCSIDFAIDLFAKARSPGIYKQDYLDKFIQNFANKNFTSIRAPLRPAWCQTHETIESNRNKRSCDSQDPGQYEKRVRKDINEHSGPKFAVELEHVKPVCSQPTLDNIRLKCQKMCYWNRQSFPGSQPVSMDYTNHETIFQSPYMVSWKADGTRYMMLIEGQNQVYMLDRNNNVFQINQLWFPEDPDCTRHLTNTLIDGEFVIDIQKDGSKRYRYLVYDIVTYENDNVGQKSFEDRLRIIHERIVNVRDEAITKGHINKTFEPFSIRKKDFWDLSVAPKLLDPTFQNQLLHGSDGLIFQPKLDPYQSGRSVRVFKWKEDNTIDFQLKITETERPAEKVALLYVNHQRCSYASMPYSSELDQYNNQIIECSYRKGEWCFYRHRADKTYANAQTTADRVMTAIKHPITKDILCSLIEEHFAFVNY